MQPLQNQQTNQQLPSTGNPQNIGQNSVLTQQSNLQQTAGQDAFTSTTDKGVPIRIDMRNLTSEVQKQAAPPAGNNSKANLLWSISIISLIVAITLWVIGTRVQNKSA